MVQRCASQGSPITAALPVGDDTSKISPNIHGTVNAWGNPGARRDFPVATSVREGLLPRPYYPGDHLRQVRIRVLIGSSTVRPRRIH